MHAAVLRELGVERGDEDTALPGQYDLAPAVGQGRYRGMDAGDFRRANEHHLQRFGAQVVRQRRSQRHKAVNLPSVGVTSRHNVNESQTPLRRQGLLRQQDEACAGSEDGSALGMKLLKSRAHRHRRHESQQRRAFPAWNDDPLHVSEIGWLLDEFRLDAQFAKHPFVSGEIALQGQEANTRHVDLPAPCLQQLAVVQAADVNPHHGFAEVFGHARQQVGVKIVGRRLHDGLGTALRVA